MDILSYMRRVSRVDLKWDPIEDESVSVSMHAAMHASRSADVAKSQADRHTSPSALLDCSSSSCFVLPLVFLASRSGDFFPTANTRRDF
jgi:hypothetical protein